MVVNACPFITAPNASLSFLPDTASPRLNLGSFRMTMHQQAVL